MTWPLRVRSAAPASTRATVSTVSRVLLGRSRLMLAQAPAQSVALARLLALVLLRVRSAAPASTRATVSTASCVQLGSSLRILAPYLVMNVRKATCLVMVHLYAASARRGLILLTRVEPRVSSVLWANSLQSKIPLVVRIASQAVSRQLGLPSAFLAKSGDRKVYLFILQVASLRK